MILEIDDTKTIADLQDRFSECFPDLKIEFYKAPHKWKRPSLSSDRIDPSERIGSIRKKHVPGTLEIKSWYQTGKVEKDFRELFGLNIQVFRKSDKTWVQTISTDTLTLREQEQAVAKNNTAR